MSHQHNYQVGSVIRYEAFGEKRTVRVTNRLDDIKDGRPGFDGEMLNDKFSDGTNGVWGYDDQIIEVVSL